MIDKYYLECDRDGTGAWESHAGSFDSYLKAVQYARNYPDHKNFRVRLETLVIDYYGVELDESS